MPEDLIRMREVMDRMTAYQDAAKATEVAQRATDLCDRGVRLNNRNSLEAAHQLFQQAAAMFDPDDTSAGAAWAWHCLAESFRNLPTGVKIENLQQAATLYRRALKSPERRLDTWRYAMTQDGFSRCLRDFAGEVSNPDAGSKLFDGS